MIPFLTRGVCCWHLPSQGAGAGRHLTMGQASTQRTIWPRALVLFRGSDLKCGLRPVSWDRRFRGTWDPGGHCGEKAYPLTLTKTRSRCGWHAPRSARGRAHAVAQAQAVPSCFSGSSTSRNLQRRPRRGWHSCAAGTVQASKSVRPRGRGPQHRHVPSCHVSLARSVFRPRVAAVSLVFLQRLLLHSASFTCGLAGALASNPVDVVRTRMMNQRVLRDGGCAGYTGTLDCLLQTWKGDTFESVGGDVLIRCSELPPARWQRGGAYFLPFSRENLKRQHLLTLPKLAMQLTAIWLE